MLKIRSLFFIILFFVIFILSCNRDNEKKLSDVRKIGPQPDGSILVPTNQLLRPAGFQIQFQGRPVDIALSPNGKWIAVLNKSSIELIRLRDRTILQRLSVKGGSSYNGIVFSSDEKNIFVSQARNHIKVASFNEDNILTWKDEITFPNADVGGYPVPGGIALNKNYLYTTLNRDNSLAIVNLSNKSIKRIPVGVAPYKVILYSSKKAYVSNWGGRKPKFGESTYKTSNSDILVDSKTGIANNGSVSVIDLTKNRVEKNIKVGLHPGAMVLSSNKERLYVACANSDIISVIDTKKDSVVSEISVSINTSLPFGNAPNAIAISNIDQLLYVANGTQNSICVIDLEHDNKIIGLIPTGWYPGAVIFDKYEEYLIVANTKGIGSRNMKAGQYGFNTHNHMGTISVIPKPTKEQLNKMTEVVKDNNSFDYMMSEFNMENKRTNKVAIPQVPGQKSFFKHVVYIIKENRTYDQIFGDLPQGNGDSSLVHFGREVTPNHHALAEEFVLMDNYYCSGILSADGHQWTNEAYVTDYIEKYFGDFPRSYPYDGGDPLAYSPSGFIWDNVISHGLTYRNYGEFVDAVIEPRSATFTTIYNDFINGTGKIKIRAKTNLPQMEPYTCSTYIGFPEKVSDQYRAEEFIKELSEFEKNNNFPNFIIMLLPNDHTSGTEPGKPTPRAAVADNDLALGKIVEAISNSIFWKETCIFVTEDDPQAGLDHVDGHRTVGLVVSPYTKRGHVISTNYSQINMFRTIENILGIPPLNKFDLTAVPMTDCFTNKADYQPYTSIKNNIPLDEINPHLSELEGDALYWAKLSMEQDLDDYDRIDEDIFNKIIWHSVKGYDVPYPVGK